MNSVLTSRPAAAWLSGLLAFMGMQLTAWGQEPVVDPPGRVARVSFIEGKVSLATADSASDDGKEQWTDAVVNRPLTSGDKVSVEADGRAELEVGSANIYLDRDTSFGFIELDDDVLQMSLTGGAVTLRVNRMGEHETIQIETPNSTVRVRHPGEYHFEVDRSSDRTIVKTRNGEAEVVGEVNTYQVRSNEQGVFTGLQNLTAQIGGVPPRNGFESWANDRERIAQSSQSARYVSSDVIGHEDLDDNGDWYSEPEYGYVWRPRYVSYDWAPYRYGHWAWVGPWGWTWIDDARWGFAPFHYGRWAYVSSRWCWVPGPRHLRPVYAPALVGWVGGPGVSVSLTFGNGVGWFPLGPREIYVPGYRHTPRYVRYVNASNTIIVNNNYLWDIDHGRFRDWEFRHRRHPHALTFVPRDQFFGGRSLGERRVRFEEGQLRQLRDNVRPPHKELGDFRTVRRGMPGNDVASSGGGGSTLRQVPDTRGSSFAPREQNNRVKDSERMGFSGSDGSRRSSEARRSDSLRSSPSYSGSSQFNAPPKSSSAPRSGPIKGQSYSGGSSYSPPPSYSQPSKRDHMERPPKQYSAPPPSNSNRGDSGGGKSWSAPQQNYQNNSNRGGGQSGGKSGSSPRQQSTPRSSDKK